MKFRIYVETFGNKKPIYDQIIEADSSSAAWEQALTKVDKKSHGRLKITAINPKFDYIG